MKRLIIDLDETITIGDSSLSYKDKKPNKQIIERISEYKSRGFEIVIHTARNMRTFEGSIGKINAITLPIIIEWLNHHEIPYDEIYVGKPWCGFDGFYVDDRAIRPDEFLSLNSEQIANLLKNTK